MNTKKQITKFTCTAEDDGLLLVELLAQRASLSKTTIKKLMIYGAIFQSYKTTKRRIRKAKSRVRKGDFIECFYDPKIDLDQTFEFPVLYHTKHFGIYHKPCGAHTEGTNFGDKASVFRFVEKQKKFAFLVNRIDKEISGLVVIAYDSKTQNLLQSMWKKNVVKDYQAIVHGNLTNDQTFSEFTFDVVKVTDSQTFIEIHPISEKKNQIPSLLKTAGFPIVKDSEEKIQLLSCGLHLNSPHTNTPINVSLTKEDKLF